MTWSWTVTGRRHRWLRLVASQAILLFVCGCLPDAESDEQLTARIDAHLQKMTLADAVGDDLADQSTGVAGDVSSDAVTGSSSGGDTADGGVDAEDGLATGDAQPEADAAACTPCMSDFDCNNKVLGTTPCKLAACIKGCCGLKVRPAGEICQTPGAVIGTCQREVCNETGACAPVAKKDDSQCGFGKCGKKCVSGNCTNESAADWDDGNPCTKDYCDQGVEVKHEPFTDLSLACDDDNVCTENDACFSGTCVGVAKLCDDAINCTIDLCIPQIGCQNTPKDKDHGCDDGDPCTKDSCALAVGCTVTGTVPDAKCDDSNNCTADDTCSGDGSCAGKPTCACKQDADCKNSDKCAPTTCIDGFCQVDKSAAVQCTKSDSPCFENLCDPELGICKPTATGDGQSCSDGDKCVTAMTCSKGACSGGKAMNCDDNNVCTLDSCIASKGCVQLPAKATCDDNNPCTTADSCDGGACSGTVVNCDDKVNCTFDSCDAKTGKCDNKPDSSKCDDDNPCTADSCEAKKGCVSAANTAGKCDDGKVCTTNACQAGECVVTKNECPCEKDEDCDDGEACTVNTCNKTTKKCSATVANDGLACDPFDKCQQPGSGLCEKGTCKSSNKPKDCSKFADGCNNATCNPATGVCQAVARSDGTACDADSNGCTVGDQCANGVCMIGKPADCSNASASCSTAACVSTGASSFTCQKTPTASGTPCDDDLYCTIGDHCNGKGTCVGKAKRDCSELDSQCSTGSCLEASKQCEQVPLAAGTKCDDGEFCTVDDNCDPKGACIGGKPRACEAEQCSVASCDGKALKCVVIAAVKGTKCDDADGCTSQDSCDGSGKCLSKPIECDDANACTLDKCEPKTGKCTNTTAPNATCSDGNACTVGDKCDTKGDCLAGVPRQCQGQACKTASCSPGTGKCSLAPKAAGSACEDGNPCTLDDTCDKNASCVSGAPKQCAPKPCNQASCDTKTGDCKWSPTLVNTLCDDNNDCTINDVCDGAGTCKAGSVKPCPAGSCEVAVCAPKTGVCGTQAKKDGTPCDDGNKCTAQDSCKAGLCAAGLSTCGCTKDSECDDQNACTKDQCAGVAGNLKCQNTPLTGATCSDFNDCTQQDKCTSVGKCEGKAIDCDDKNECTVDQCDTANGKCTYFTRAGAPCDDGKKCTSFDICGANKACKGVPVQCDDNKPCTIDTCVEKDGKCSNTPNTGAKCDDGLLCVVNEVCTAEGTCIGTSVSCDDKNPCTADKCDVKTGKCVAPPTAGATCDDGSACTTKDVCDGAGVCKGATKNCDDGNACTDNACNPATGSCSNTKKSGKPCDDGNLCTLSDICDAAGQCVGAKPVSCSGDQCNDGQCVAATGKCSLKPKASGISCDDKDACTTTDTCDGNGSCTGAGTKFCAGDDCNTGVCVSPHGTCSKKPKAAGTTCSDGDKCTLSDRCDSKGKCVGDGEKQCGGDQCNDGACNSVTGQCGLKPKSVGTLCNDSNPCTKKDSCDGLGACRGSDPVICPGDQCNTANCDSIDGQCKLQPKANGVACNDGNNCTSNDKCDAGTCKAGAWTCACQKDDDCDDKNTCTVDKCVTDSGKLICANTVQNGASCDDASACTTADKCISTGACEGTSKVCDDKNDCTVDSCEASTGNCKFTVSVGKSCSDADNCTLEDKCDSAGKCGGTPKVCNDFNDCTDDTCQAATGSCSFTNNTKGCNDNNACSVSDVCSGGSCKGADKDCDDKNPCTDDSCDSITGSCQNAAKTGATCTDGDACTDNDACTAAGKCTGTAKNCDDGNSCTTDSCSAGNCANNANVGTTCSDGNACTNDDKCKDDGSCGAGTTKNCDDGKSCTTDACNASNGSCEHTNLPTGNACNDGNKCTSNDTCSDDGKCDGTAKICADPGVCKTGVCNPTSGSCETQNDAKGTSCNDNNLCTENDTCNGSGTCAGTTKTCPGGQCYTGYCNQTNGACLTTQKPAGSACNDGDNCTINDECKWSGQCRGANKCNDGAWCSVDSCNSSTGQCSHEKKNWRCGECKLCEPSQTNHWSGCVEKPGCDD